MEVSHPAQRIPRVELRAKQGTQAKPGDSTVMYRQRHSGWPNERPNPSWGRIERPW